MAKILHLETATKVCSIALSENGKVVRLVETEEENFSHAENLNTFFIDALKAEGWSLKDLDAIAVTSGPGSYTGLRIGVSTAKGLCFSLDIPLIAINSLESIAQQALEKFPSKNYCAVIDARRMEVFGLIVDENQNVLKPISADVIEEETYAEFENLVICGDGAAKLQEIWKHRNLTFATEIKSSAAGQAKLAFKKFQKSEFEDVAYFEPFYLKDFIALKSKKPVR